MKTLPEREEARPAMTDTDAVRAFIAVELPDQAKAALARMVGQLRRTSIVGLRPVNPEGVHLTLKFLGDVPAARTDSVVSSVSQAVQQHPHFALTLGNAGVFPRNGAPRVLWVGMGGDLAQLAELHRLIDAALEALAFPRDSREFSPHLTIARIREGTPSADRKKAADTLFAAEDLGAGIRIDVVAVSLIRSILGHAGAVYQRLALMPLAEDAHRDGAE